MIGIEIVGYCAGFLVSISLLPQIIKIFKTRSTRDISIVWTVIFMSGLTLWIVYAIVNSILPLLVFGLIELTFASTIFIFKLIYK